MRNSFKKSKLYGIFVRSDDGTLMGYVENSFCMSWERNYVRAWRTFDDVKRIFEGLNKDRKKSQESYLFKIKKSDDLFIARLGSKDCPVSISNWTPLKESNGHGRKFTWRNALFSKK